MTKHRTSDEELPQRPKHCRTSQRWRTATAKVRGSPYIIFNNATLKEVAATSSYFG